MVSMRYETVAQATKQTVRDVLEEFLASFAGTGTR